MSEHPTDSVPADNAPGETPTAADGAAESEYTRQRRDKRARIAELGLDPYGGRTTDLIPLAEVADRYDPDADRDHQANAKAEGFVDRRPTVRVAGRVVLHRDNGKLVWMNLRDATGDLQIAVSKRDCDEQGFELAKLTDLADLVVAEGPVMKTRAGEITIWCSSLRPASKSLVPPPEKHAGLTDPEARYRQRYVDLWANPEGLDTLRLRSRLVARTRRFLDERGFMEVETPTLQTLAGGAAARPFVTHMNALSIDLFMRVAPELYLKRLLVGGMPRVYEMARCFRNEGVDRTHNPEFTMLELYEAYADYGVMMELTESLIKTLAGLVAEHRGETPSELRLPFADHLVDYSRPFRRATYESLFADTFGFEMHDADRVRAEASRRGMETRGVDPLLLVNALFGVVEDGIGPEQPTFVIDYPAPLCPLTRSKPGRPEIAERFELFMGGFEVANAYTELNDPDIQEARFRAQLSGLDAEESTFRTLDEDFLHALRVGMPPAGGLGIGIDRLMMVLLNRPSIRDVLLFPLMRPHTGQDANGNTSDEEDPGNS
ncbi:MAG: lysine--tRNA ligase [Phycisphaerales bacterium JB037]